MPESRLMNSVRNVLFGLLKYIVSIIFPFLIRTIMIKKMGEEYVGLNSLFSSILQMLNLSELGFGTAMVYSMYKPVADKNVEMICALLNLYKRVYRIIGSFIGIAGLLLLPFLPYLVPMSYPQEINIYYLYLLYLANTALSYFLYAYKNAILVSCQHSDIESVIYTLVYLVVYSLQIFALQIRSYYLYVFLFLCATAGINILTAIITHGKYPDYICKGTVSKTEKKNILKKVYALFGHQMGAVVINSFDNIVISMFSGLTVLALYNNYSYIISSLVSVILICVNAITASIGNSVIKESLTKNSKDFKTLNFIINWINSWCSICLLCLFQHFMKLWMGENRLFDMLTVLLLVMSFYIRQLRRPVLIYINALGLWFETRYIPYAASALNLILNLVLVSVLGLNGVILSTIISYLAIELPWEIHILFTKYFRSGYLSYYKGQLKYFFISAMNGVLCYLVCSYINDSGLLYFVLKCLICLILPNTIFYLAFKNTKEWKKVMEYKSSILKSRLMR